VKKSRFIFGGLAALGGLIAMGPRVRVEEDVQLPDLPDDLEAYLAGAEAQYPDITPGAEKTIIWAKGGGETLDESAPDSPITKTRTPLSVVYLHGFSATRQETAPLADIVARELGANLFYTRLTGHGLPGRELGKAHARDWLVDTAEAIAIGERLGDRIVLIGTSTGGTLATWAAMYPRLCDRLAALILLSPNFGPANRFADLLLLPWARHFAETLLGDEQYWKPHNRRHDVFWTNRFPTRALLPMMALVRLVRSKRLENIKTPVLMGYSRDDVVVDVDKAARTVDRFSSPSKKILDLGDVNARHDHILAGDILAPQNTEPLAKRIVDFVRGT
jgi:esterase/lipase